MACRRRGWQPLESGVALRAASRRQPALRVVRGARDGRAGLARYPLEQGRRPAGRRGGDAGRAGMGAGTAARGGADVAPSRHRVRRARLAGRYAAGPNACRQGSRHMCPLQARASQKSFCPKDTPDDVDERPAELSSSSRTRWPRSASPSSASRLMMAEQTAAMCSPALSRPVASRTNPHVPTRSTPTARASASSTPCCANGPGPMPFPSPGSAHVPCPPRSAPPTPLDRTPLSAASPLPAPCGRQRPL
jgi:hypothetical protein